MKVALGLAVAAVAFGTARVARTAASHHRQDGALEEPYTPSPQTARFLSLGYHEALADVLYVRLRGYFGTYYGTTANGIASLGEAIVALDPRFRGIYDYAPSAMTIAERGIDQTTFLRAIAILERGMREFPDDWRLPLFSGQIYIQDLKTDDATQRRAWDERGVLLVESAIRKPGASLEAARWAAHMRTKLGQRERAIAGLRELLLVTPDGPARKKLLESLTKLVESDANEIVAEILESKNKFESAWRRERPFVNASMYLLVGPRLQPGFDMTDLATGGRDLVGSEEIETLEPLE